MNGKHFYQWSDRRTARNYRGHLNIEMTLGMWSIISLRRTELEGHKL